MKGVASGTRRRPVAANAIDANAEEDRIERVCRFAMCRRHVGRLPPHRPPLENFLGDFPLARALRSLGQFFIASRNDDAYPFLRAIYNVGLHTHQRVRAHPTNLLAKRREAVKVASPA